MPAVDDLLRAAVAAAAAHDVQLMPQHPSAKDVDTGCAFYEHLLQVRAHRRCASQRQGLAFPRVRASLLCFVCWASSFWYLQIHQDHCL